MKDGSQRRRIVGVIRPLVSLLAVLGMMGLGLYVLGGEFLAHYWKVHRSERFLETEIDHASVAQACEDLFKMLGTNDSIHLGGDDSSLPDAIHQLHSARVHVWTNQVKIVFGGGFHHWGLAYADQLEPNPKTKALEFWSDGQESKRLWPKSLAR